MGYRSNPLGALLQAEWLGAKGEWGRFGPTHSGVGVHPPRRGAPDVSPCVLVWVLYGVFSGDCTELCG